MSVNLYHTWLEQFEQIAGKTRITVLRNFTWLMLGMLDQVLGLDLSTQVGFIRRRS